MTSFFPGPGRLTLLVLVLSAASCTAILGIGGDFKQAGAGGSGARAAGGGSTTGSTVGSGGSAGATTTSNGGAGGSTSSSTGAGGDPLCTSCIEAHCVAELDGAGGSGGAAQGCLDDPTCQSWYDCLKACGDSACATGCDQSYNAKSLYTPVYMCAAASCVTECVAIDPATHPCKVGAFFPPGPGDTTLYCPFGVPDAGNGFCDPSHQHCCEPTASPSSCEAFAVPCGGSDVDWHCQAPADCQGAADVCCTNSASADLVFAATPQCETTAPTLTGTHCGTGCDSGQHELQVCTKNSQCTAPQKCWPVLVHGVNIGACH